MMRPEFMRPDFIENNSSNEIHQRMMKNLPDDIDDMPGGFPYDFTMPAALEKDELINYHLTRAIMIAFPQYAWDDWLDRHGRQVHLERHDPGKASGIVLVTGEPGTVLASGTVFCTPATGTAPSVRFSSEEDAEIGDDGHALVGVVAEEAGTTSNVAANTVSLMARPGKTITSVTNPEPITGGTERETDDDYYERIAAEYDSSMTFLGNDADYIRWAKQAGAGDCKVIPMPNEPGVVKLVLVDGNGQPANTQLVEAVYDHIVSPADREKRLLPTGCARLICTAATTVLIHYRITGLLYDDTTNLDTIKQDFAEAVKVVYARAKSTGVLRYNDVRPIITGIAGVTDFEDFLMGGGMGNITIDGEEYPETGTLDFS